MSAAPARRLLVGPAQPEQAAAAAALQARLAAKSCPIERIGSGDVTALLGGNLSGTDLLVVVAEDGLRLAGRFPSGLATLHVDYAAGAFRRRYLGARSSLLAKAIGGRREGILVDATAGIGRDTLALAALGDVVAIERDPLLHALLEDAWTRAGAQPRMVDVARRVRLVEGDAHRWLTGPDRTPIAAVVIDPMFEERASGSEVKKEMQLLRRLLPPSEEGEVQGLVDAALEVGAGRVVVKRQRGASPFARRLLRTLDGRGFRWEVYAP